MKELIRLLPVIAVVLAGCYYDNEEELYPTSENGTTACDTVGITYSQSILPILQENCVSCHQAQAPSGGVVLEGHASVQTQALNGRLLGAISHSPGFSPMPQNGNKLPECDIKAVEVWISAGAPNN